MEFIKFYIISLLITSNPKYNDVIINFNKMRIENVIRNVE